MFTGLYLPCELKLALFLIFELVSIFFVFFFFRVWRRKLLGLQPAQFTNAPSSFSKFQLEIRNFEMGQHLSCDHHPPLTSSRKSTFSTRNVVSGRKTKKSRKTNKQSPTTQQMTAAVANIFELFDESMRHILSPSDDSFDSLLYTASPPPSSTSASEHEPEITTSAHQQIGKEQEIVVVAKSAFDADDANANAAPPVLLPTSVPIVSLAAEMEKFRQLTAFQSAFGEHAAPVAQHTDADDEGDDDDDEFAPSSDMSSPLTQDDSDASSSTPYGKRARSVAHSKRGSSDGGSSGDDANGAPVKRKGRRAAAEIIIARVGDPSKLNAPPADCDPSIRRVALTRERLLTISGEEMEQRFDELNSMFSLSAAEQKEMRRQRRLVKNREYAQQSRNKKKVAATSVDCKLDGLKRSNDELRERVRAAEQEAASMRARIDAALNIATSAGAAGAALIAALVGSAQAAAEPIATVKRRRRGDATDAEDALPQSGGNGAAAAGGAVLMVMLLSFGVFLNAGLLSRSAGGDAIAPQAATTTTTTMRSAPMGGAAPAARGQQFTGRTLLGTCDDEMFAASPLSNGELGGHQWLAGVGAESDEETEEQEMPELVV
jgi:hypothetical protein